jgi:peptidoglycan biosynthesis protein MviN/MurJ (putative lipid II flippase)
MLRIIHTVVTIALVIGMGLLVLKYFFPEMLPHEYDSTITLTKRICLLILLAYTFYAFTKKKKA